VFPRLVIAGLSGDSGKTVVSLAIVLAARRRGLEVQPFKKGPDYIDAAWLGWASGVPSRNLDTFLMGPEVVVPAFARRALTHGLNIIEGNRGLYDGVDARGTHSTAELAKLLDATVILVVNATKATRTIAAAILGCQTLDPEVSIAGVVLNHVAGVRHERVIREAVTEVCGIPVVGAIPRVGGQTPIPGRHLGLITPEEHQQTDQVRTCLAELIAPHLDMDAILEIARRQGAGTPASPQAASSPVDGHNLRIGYIRDTAFTFYYPDNLEALEAAGATLVPVRALHDPGLPDDLDALYIGGGFPETHAVSLSDNRAFMASLRAGAAAGLPIYAECGGLVLLSRSLRWAGRQHAMAGILAVDTEGGDKPQGHGYVVLRVDTPNPFFAVGAGIRGHEFHYSRIVRGTGLPATACAVERGSGCGTGRDALVIGSVWASYTHVHALGTPEWADGMIRAALGFSQSRLAGRS
jgi:cobyrinic acid a,c-diamide synthase